MDRKDSEVERKKKRGIKGRRKRAIRDGKTGEKKECNRSKVVDKEDTREERKKKLIGRRKGTRR